MSAEPADAALVARWRAATPACEARVHLNNAGASLMPLPVQQAIRAHLDREAAIGGYEAFDAAAAALAEAYDDVATVVGTKPRNIAVAPSATDAFALALASFDFAPGDVLLTSTDDYISNQLMYLSLARRRGVRLVRCADAPEGGIDLADWSRRLRAERPKLAALTWIPTNSGLVQPVAEAGRLAREAGVPFLVDGCQAVGQVVVEMDAIHCDFLAATARKFLRGPRGIGFLAVSDGVLARGLHPLLLDMRGADWVAADDFALFDGARRFEHWETSAALVLGMGAAARYAREVGIARGADRASALAARARARFSAIDGVRGLDRGPRLGAIATFTVRGRVARELVLALREAGINTSAQATGDARIDLERKGVETLLRVSPHYYNTEDELERAARALEALLRTSPA